MRHYCFRCCHCDLLDGRSVCSWNHFCRLAAPGRFVYHWRRTLTVVWRFSKGLEMSRLIDVKKVDSKLIMNGFFKSLLYFLLKKVRLSCSIDSSFVIFSEWTLWSAFSANLFQQIFHVIYVLLLPWHLHIIQMANGEKASLSLPHQIGGICISFPVVCSTDGHEILLSKLCLCI